MLGPLRELACAVSSPCRQLVWAGGEKVALYARFLEELDPDCSSDCVENQA